MVGDQYQFVEVMRVPPGLQGLIHRLVEPEEMGLEDPRLEEFQ